jgi:hypothetical protein
MSPTPGFYDALRLHVRRVRTFRRLPSQYLRVAWALSEKFHSGHGIAFASMETYGALAGGVDRRDVKRALLALVDADCVRPVSQADLLCQIEPSSGRPPNGFRMVIDNTEDLLESAAALVHRGDPVDPERRFAARSARTKSSVSTVPPKSREQFRDLQLEGFGGGGHEFWGHSAPTIGKAIGLGDGLEPSPHTPAQDQSLVSRPRAVAPAPEGAVLTDDQLQLGLLCFGKLSVGDRDSLQQLAGRIGSRPFSLELVNLGQRQLSGPTGLTVQEWVELVGLGMRRESAHA